MTIVLREADEYQFRLASGGFGLTGRDLRVTFKNQAVEVFAGRRLWGDKPLTGDNSGSATTLELSYEEMRALRDWLNEHL